MRRFFLLRFEFLKVLGNRDYRVYYLGLLASVTAHQGMVAVQGWLVYELTGLPAALGFVAAAQAVPGIVFNLLSGALADRMDPRRLIVAGESFAAALMVLLATLVLFDSVNVWHIGAVAFLQGVAISFDQPARRAIWPVLVPREHMMFAASLNQGVWNGMRIVGPGVATGIIAVVDIVSGNEMLGASIALYAIAAGFGAMALSMMLIRFPAIERSTGATVFHDIVDGLVFTYRNRVLLMLLAMSLVMGFFGLSYQYLMPAFAADVLGVGPAGLGALLAASGVGGMIGMLGVASFGAYQNRAWLLATGAILSGAAVVLFALTALLPWLGLAVAIAALAGLLWALFNIASSTLLQLLVPPVYRGRVMGLRGLTWLVAPLGALQAGLVATWVSVPFAIGLGGVVVVVFTLAVFSLSPRLRGIRHLVDEAMAQPSRSASA